VTGKTHLEPDPSASAAQRDQAAWLANKEQGTITAIRFVVGLCNFAGRRAARAFVSVLMVYYTVFASQGRRASRAFLSELRGRPATWLDAYRHLRTFGLVTLDRVFLLLGSRGFVVRSTGHHYLDTLTRERRGAVLLGAHLGSFEAMRAGARSESLPLNIVGHFENARMINALLSHLNPHASARVVHVGKDPVGFAMQVSERLAQGELVAILADRVGLNDKQISVRFLGQEAAFPTGPFLLASLLKCPVYLVFGLYFEPNRYELFCEPFAERIELPRKQRQQALQEVVQRYAARLEHYARQAPDNWFNFYDFWKSEKP